VAAAGRRKADGSDAKWTGQRARGSGKRKAANPIPSQPALAGELLPVRLADPHGAWGTVFGDAIVATAILDRPLRHSHVISVPGDSYRVRAKRRSGLLQKTTAAETAGNVSA
jgi:IstB-like ATP binding protein